jgi:hypothetical protein
MCVERRHRFWSFAPRSHWWWNLNFFGFIFPQIHGRLYGWNRRRKDARHALRRARRELV